VYVWQTVQVHLNALGGIVGAGGAGVGDGPVEALEALEIDAGEARAAPVIGEAGPVDMQGTESAGWAEGGGDSPARAPR